MKFTKFAIYQLPFENENVRDMYFMSPNQIEEISDQYEFVAIIEARNLNHVFEISNCCGEIRRSIDRQRIVGNHEAREKVHFTVRQGSS